MNIEVVIVMVVGTEIMIMPGVGGARAPGRPKSPHHILDRCAFARKARQAKAAGATILVSISFQI